MYSTRPPPPNAHILLISESGFIPLVIPQLIDGEEQTNIIDKKLIESSFNDGNRKNNNRHQQLLSSYCYTFSFDLKSCLCFIPHENIRVLFNAEPLFTGVNNNTENKYHEKRTLHYVAAMKDKNTATLVLVGWYNMLTNILSMDVVINWTGLVVTFFIL